MEKLYGWKVKPDAVVTGDGIVSGFSVAARLCTPERGISANAVYNEFSRNKNNVGIPQINAPLIERVEGRVLTYEVTGTSLKSKLRSRHVLVVQSP